MPNVVMPQLGLFQGTTEGGRGSSSNTNIKLRGRGRLQSITKVTTSTAQPLSVLSERSVESPPPERAQSYPSLHSEGDESTHSTLKASSTSNFETDSLERSDRLAPVVPLSPAVESPLLETQVSNLFPPTPGTAHHQPNLMINYAHQEGTSPLSPIWGGRFHPLSSDAESSEYITSYIGTCSTPSPRGEGCVKRVGADSGQGESSEEEEEGSDESDPDEVSQCVYSCSN